MKVDILGFMYAGLVAAGGILGYVKAGSVPSLAAGLIFGGALIYGAYKMSIEPSNYIPQLVTSSILAGAMGYRFYISGNIVPAALVCIVSVAVMGKIALGATGVLSGWCGSDTKESNIRNVAYEPTSNSTMPSTTITTDS